MFHYISQAWCETSGRWLAHIQKRDSKPIESSVRRLFKPFIKGIGRSPPHHNTGLYHFDHKFNRVLQPAKTQLITVTRTCPKTRRLFTKIVSGRCLSRYYAIVHINEGQNQSPASYVNTLPETGHQTGTGWTQKNPVTGHIDLWTHELAESTYHMSHRWI